jgi:UDP-glucose 4-epimerase
MSALEGRRILVTGGAGFIGSHLVERLVERNEVVVLDDLRYGRRENLSGLRCTLLEQDVRETDLEALLRARNIDLVFHLAAFHLSDSLTDPWTDFTVSAIGGLRLLEALRKVKVLRLVYASTGSVYGEPSEALHDEEHPLLPTTPYGASKATMDHYCRIYQALFGIEAVRLRYYNVYGPRRTAGAIPQFILRAMRGQSISIEGGDQVRTPTNVSDIVDATMSAAIVPEASGLAFNLAASEAISVMDMAQRIVRLCGAEGRVAFKHGGYRPGEIMELRPNVELARRVLGWQASVPFDRGVAELIEHLRPLAETDAAAG